MLSGETRCCADAKQKNGNRKAKTLIHSALNLGGGKILLGYFKVTSTIAHVSQK